MSNEKQKIDELDKYKYPLNLADSTTEPISQLQDKLNEVIRLLNKRKI